MKAGTCFALLSVVLVAPLAAAQTTRPVNRTDAHGNAIRVATRTGHVSNYDESKVGTYSLPDPLTLNDGTPVRDAQTWYTKRRPEILELYNREIYGAVPANAPHVTWEGASTDPNGVNGTAITKHLVGHVGDKPDGPKLNVTLDIPDGVTGPVPVVLCINF